MYTGTPFWLDNNAASAIFVTLTASSALTLGLFLDSRLSMKLLISSVRGSCFSFLGVSEPWSFSILTSWVIKSPEIIPSVQTALKCLTREGVIQFDDIIATLF